MEVHVHMGRYAIFQVMGSTAADNDVVRDLMGDVDRTLLRENLKLSFEQRALKHLRVLQMVENFGGRAKSCDRKVIAVDLALVIPPLVRAKVKSKLRRAQIFSGTRACRPACWFPFPKACPTH
jgi:hypothetical protein